MRTKDGSKNYNSTWYTRTELANLDWKLHSRIFSQNTRSITYFASYFEQKSKFKSIYNTLFATLFVILNY